MEYFHSLNCIDSKNIAFVFLSHLQQCVIEVSSLRISYNYFLMAPIFVALWQESTLVSVRACTLPDTQQP